MSRHLDQTGPNVTTGNQSGFYQTEKKADVPASAPCLSLSRVQRVGRSGVPVQR